MLDKSQEKTLAGALTSILIWLDSEQSIEAVMSHHGITRKEWIGPLRLSVCQGVGGWPVLVFTHELDSALRYGSTDWKGFSKRDIKQLHSIISNTFPIRSFWNGVGFGTVSFSIGKPFGPGVAMALRNYHDAGNKIFDEDWWKAHPVKVTRPDDWR